MSWRMQNVVAISSVYLFSEHAKISIEFELWAENALIKWGPVTAKLTCWWLTLQPFHLVRNAATTLYTTIHINIQSTGLCSLSGRTSYRKISTRGSRQVSKPRDSCLDFSNRSEIWQAPRQQRCRAICQISEQYDNNNTNLAASRLNEILR